MRWVFQLCFRKLLVGINSLKVKKKDYQSQILVNYSCHDWICPWVSGCVFGKAPRGCFSWQLEYGLAPKWFCNDFLCIYSPKRWQSVSWYNLHKEHNKVKDFLKWNNFSNTGYNTDNIQKAVYSILNKW